VGHPVTVSICRDSTYEYVKVFCFVLIAALVTVVWSLLDRKSAGYPRLHQWIRFWVRIVVAFTLIGYGTFKVVPAQMPPPGLTAMAQPFGDFGPYPPGLLWSFMGASQQYVVLCGLVETTAGILLLTPGLTTLGALLAMGAVSQVFVMSGFYQVPVVLGVGHLFLLASFLLVPQTPRLLNLLVLNRGNEPERRLPIVRPRWLNYSLWVVQWAIAISLIHLQISHSLTFTEANKKIPQTIPLYGIWTVDEFSVDGQLHPPLLTDTLRWQRVIFDSDPLLSPKMLATIQGMNGEFYSYIAAPGTQKNALSWRNPTKEDLAGGLRELHIVTVGTPWNGELTYTLPTPDELVLDGSMSGHQLHLKLKNERRHFPQQDLKFRWITEDRDIGWGDSQ
jgi:uncharacterized membrane protein YphA (DoxX/SURF4 family)